MKNTGEIFGVTKLYRMTRDIIFDHVDSAVINDSNWDDICKRIVDRIESSELIPSNVSLSDLTIEQFQLNKNLEFFEGKSYNFRLVFFNHLNRTEAFELTADILIDSYHSTCRNTAIRELNANTR